MRRLPQRSMLRLLAVGAAAGLLVAGCGDDDDAATGPDEPATEETTTTRATEPEPEDGSDAEEGADDGAAAGDGPTLTIQNFNFEQGVSVAAGTPLTIVNEDGVAHTFTARDNTFDSGSIDGNSSAEVTVDQPGEYEYFCAIHPQMTGTLTVEG